MPRFQTCPSPGLDTHLVVFFAGIAVWAPSLPEIPGRGKRDEETKAEGAGTTPRSAMLSLELAGACPGTHTAGSRAPNCSLGLLRLLEHPWGLHPLLHPCSYWLPESWEEGWLQPWQRGEGPGSGWAQCHATTPGCSRALRFQCHPGSPQRPTAALGLGVFSSPAMSPISCYLFSLPFCISSPA